MPDGKPFAFWDDKTRYGKTYHVACKRAGASDANPGTFARPFKTMGRAAAILKPGEKVVVHEGTYRECVRPARGGDSARRMIAYEAAPDERVIVSGSEVWKPAFVPTAGWSMGAVPAAARIWMADLPAEWFTGYNPFLANNVFGEYTTFISNWSPAETHRFQLRRGMIFVRERPLTQVFRIEDLAKTQGAFWVEGPGSRIHLRLWDDADPNGVPFEVTTREQVFAPAAKRLGYMRVKGFRFQCAADGIPVPQRACLSTAQGHHWIIEGNTIRWSNACGMDIGAQHWSAASYHPCGGHIVRRNAVSDCGICGIAGVTHVDGSLLEDNVVERIGGLNVERLFECAGVKLHVSKGVLFRRNVVRHLRHAGGLWLDYLNVNCRVTENVFADIASVMGGVFLEVSHELNVIDHNVVWDIRGEPWDWAKPDVIVDSGHGIKLDSCDHVVVAHNLVGTVRDGFALSLSHNQNTREVGGRIGQCRDVHALNNIIVQSPKRILLGQVIDNSSDGNLFDESMDAMSFTVSFPEPKTQQNLRGWRECLGFDRHGAQAKLECEFDADKLELNFLMKGRPSRSQKVAALHAKKVLPPGPFDAATWAKAKTGRRITLRFCCARP